MSCACGSGGDKAPKKRYVWTGPNGQTLTRNSQTEVDYLVSRKGGSWVETTA